MEAGIHVICDKPLVHDSREAKALMELEKKKGLVFALTHNYSGYPMIRQAREMVQTGVLGEIRVVQAEYPQDWLTTKLEDEGHKQAGWRTDPKITRHRRMRGRHRHSRLSACLFCFGFDARNLSVPISAPS